MEVNKGKCVGCGTCFNICPVNAIKMDENGIAQIDKNICIQCGACKNLCPVEAINNK